MFVEYINVSGQPGEFERLGIQKRVDMTGYYTKAEVDTALAQLEARISADSSTAADTYALKTDVSAFQTAQEVKDADIDASIDALQDEIVTKASVASVEAVANGTYTKEEIDNKDTAAVANAVGQAKDYADAKFLEIDSSINDIKEIIPNLITNDVLTTALSAYTNSVDLEQAYVTKEAFATDLNGYDTSIQSYIADQINGIDYSSFAMKNELPDFTLFATKAELPDFTAFATKAELPDFNSFASKNDISTAIDAEDASIQSYVTGHINQIGQQIEAIAQSQTQVVLDDELTENGENAVKGKTIYKAIVDNEKVVSAGLNKAFEDIKDINENLADLGGVEIVSDSFDYIYDETTWNESFANGALKKYYTKYPDEDRYNTQAHRWAWEADKVDGEWPDYCIQCWEGAISADGAKFPWVCPNFDEDVNAIIRFEYKGKTAVLPWGSNVFGIGRKADGTDRLWGIAAVAEEFQDNSFLLPQIKNGSEIYNGNADWAGTEGDKSFDITKFRMILIKQDEKNTVKSYVDQKFAELLFQLS
jgi:hypothetical protein